MEKSNADAQVLIAAQAKFEPDGFLFFGIPGYDDKVADLGPDNGERFRAAMDDAKATLEKKLQAEHDPNVRQDLPNMIKAAEERIQGRALRERLLLPWHDAPQLGFSGPPGLRSDQTTPARPPL